MRLDTEVKKILKTRITKAETGALYYEVTSDDGTVYPVGTEVTFHGTLDQLMSEYMSGVVHVTLPNGEERNLEPDAVGWHGLGI